MDFQGCPLDQSPSATFLGAAVPVFAGTMVLVFGTVESIAALTSSLLMQGEICNIEELICVGQICKGAGQKTVSNSARKGLWLHLQKASLQEPRTKVRSSVASFTCR